MQGFDSFDDDEEGGDEFASFEEFGVREARKLRGYLEDLDHKVFDVQAVVSQEAEQEEKAKSRRYYSVGYDAHQEVVTDKDLAEWQRAFPQLRVCGVQIPAPSADADADADADTNAGGGVGELDEEYGRQNVGGEAAEGEDREPDLTMAVRGSRVQLHRPTRLQEVTHFPHKRDFTEYGESAVGTGVAVMEDEEPETILVMDGILEEVIAVDYSDDTRATRKAGGSSPPVSPTSARKYEMTSLLLDSVWPNVVEALRPLVERVVRHQLEHGIPVDEEPPAQRSEWSDVDEEEDQSALKISAW